jgi:hypothetical protein
MRPNDRAGGRLVCIVLRFVSACEASRRQAGPGVGLDPTLPRGRGLRREGTIGRSGGWLCGAWAGSSCPLATAPPR